MRRFFLSMIAILVLAFSVVVVPPGGAQAAADDVAPIVAVDLGMSVAPIPISAERFDVSYSLIASNNTATAAVINTPTASSAVGATPYIAFQNKIPVPAHEDTPWSRMYFRFALNREEYLERYHQRSNVETVFSMIKAKFGDSVRSKTDTAMVNEVLCKVVAHNLCCLNQATHELGVAVAL